MSDVGKSEVRYQISDFRPRMEIEVAALALALTSDI